MITGLKLKGISLLAAGFTAATITAIVASAASGDAVYIRLMPPVQVATVEGAAGKAVACAKMTHPALVVANIESYRVLRKDGANGEDIFFSDGTETKTEAKVLRYARALKGQNAGGASDDFNAKLDWTRLLFDANQCWSEYIALTHGYPDARLASLSFERKEGGKFYSTITLIVTDTLDQYFDDVDNGVAIKPLDLVE